MQSKVRRRRAEQWRQSVATTDAGEGQDQAATATRDEEPPPPGKSGPEEAARRGAAEELRCCRICLDSEEDAATGRLFSPCRCSGSMRFVHVACLDQWRATAANEAAYYRCDACHYEYRLERVRVARLLLSPAFHRCLAFLAFALGAGICGSLCQWRHPELLRATLDRLQLPPAARSLVVLPGPTGTGNSACWHTGYSYEACCFGRERGNPACWDAQYTFDACCHDSSETWRTMQEIMVPKLQILASGVLVLSLVGFGFFVWRQVHQAWGDHNGQWNLVWVAMSMGSLNNQALARFVALIGCAAALRELFFILSARAKKLSIGCCDRVLEVASV
eukprot:TRINITY_DN34274_c0_g1_i1.p1 TRINITY_DN34274_c0_g1~~TRINITY_DN34274_c0_g1_i1.p1  ORF type:complete len:334 (-),score=50.64 TRINITY_DN34274_c0_g1_i1:51-1052(-)